MKASVKNFFVVALVAMDLFFAFLIPIGLSAQDADIVVYDIVLNPPTPVVYEPIVSITIWLKNIGSGALDASPDLLNHGIDIPGMDWSSNNIGGNGGVWEPGCSQGFTLTREAIESLGFNACFTSSGPQRITARTNVGYPYYFAKETNYENNSLTKYVRVEKASASGRVGKNWKKFLLLNFPNPFNPVTTIRYSLAADGNVKLTVFDMLGKEVAVLADGYQKAGEHQATWNASPSRFSSGTYFYKLESEGDVIMGKMILLK